MREALPYIATMTTHTLTIKQAIERAVEGIEQGEHGPTRHAMQSPVDLRDAMMNALARLSSRTDKLASHTVNGSPLSANDE
jgi:hypothetical protein